MPKRKRNDGCKLHCPNRFCSSNRGANPSPTLSLPTKLRSPRRFPLVASNKAKRRNARYHTKREDLQPLAGCKNREKARRLPPRTPASRSDLPTRVTRGAHQSSAAARDQPDLPRKRPALRRGGAESSGRSEPTQVAGPPSSLSPRWSLAISTARPRLGCTAPVLLCAVCRGM